MILDCMKCSKPIDAQPPACPSCGARQPEPGAVDRLRVAWLCVYSLVSIAAGSWYGAGLRVDFMVKQMRARFHQGPGVDAEKEALRARLKELVGLLKADREAPFLELEDALLEPSRHSQGNATIVAYLFSVKTPGGNTGRLSVGWGHGAMLDLDLSALPEADRIRAVGLVEKPHFVSARGQLRATPGDPVFHVTAMEDLGVPRGIETLPELLR